MERSAMPDALFSLVETVQFSYSIINQEMSDKLRNE